MSETTHMVHVALSPRGDDESYDIQVGSGTLAAAADFLKARARVSHAIVITDSGVLTLYGQPTADHLTAAGIRTSVFSFPAGEASKSVASAERLWEELAQSGADRKSVVVAVGGGVVGDLAGFVAATYARGLKFLQVPTTLLAQVDSSVGGKVAVNLSQAKNMVGAFWQPLGVLIDTDVLSTLPDREYRAGLAEVVKYGVILDADFFAWLEEHADEINDRDAKALQHIIARCCRLKADVVQQDPREETGLRAVLNYGHTFAHALETATAYGQVLHGEAVSVGMLCASRLAEQRGRVDRKFTARQEDLLVRLGLPTKLPKIPHDDLIDLMRRDKKVEHGKLRFVLPVEMGKVELVGDVDPAAVRAALKG